MNFLELFGEVGTTSTLLNLALVAITGILIGKIKFVKIKLGIAGVLFTGIIAGHLGAQLDSHVLHFVKEFGLILFVYSIGIDIGPRFISSFRSNGVKLNLLAASIVFMGFAIALSLKFIFDIDVPVIAGIFCGSVTNTPALGAVQSLITEQFQNGELLAETSGTAYAVAYPFGILGIIIVMFIIRAFFRLKVNDEIDSFKVEEDSKSQKLETVNLVITNPNLFGKTLKFFKSSVKEAFVFSRLQREGNYLITEEDSILKENDIIYGLASKQNFAHLEITVGKVSLTKKVEMSGQLAMRHIILTNRKLVGKRINDIGFSDLYPANITRIFRGQIEIVASGDTSLEFGDTVRVVGSRERMTEIAKFLGNSMRELSNPNLIPLFIGIFLGILLGSISFTIPNLPSPAKLGLAGGPLVIALILGHKGRIGSFDFYMTPGANLFIREMGIVLFLACVGLGSGKYFWETLINGGYIWMLYGATITFIPLFVVGVISRMLKFNYLTICGMLSGSMTDPPALEFANSIAPVHAQASAYATVYPLTMFLRILLAQILVLILT